jgi:hypothetical protein
MVTLQTEPGQFLPFLNFVSRFYVHMAAFAVVRCRWAEKWRSSGDSIGRGDYLFLQAM